MTRMHWDFQSPRVEMTGLTVKRDNEELPFSTMTCTCSADFCCTERVETNGSSVWDIWGIRGGLRAVSTSDPGRHLEPAAVRTREQFVCLRVVEGLACGVEGEFPAQAEGDVAEVAEAGAEMPDLDIRAGRGPVLHAVEEVLDMSGLVLSAR